MLWLQTKPFSFHKEHQNINSDEGFISSVSFSLGATGIVCVYYYI